MTMPTGLPGQIIAGDSPGAAGDEQQQAALLFEHGVDMIAAVIGALKACKTYVPLDISYPVKRLLYITGKFRRPLNPHQQSKS